MASAADFASGAAVNGNTEGWNFGDLHLGWAQLLKQTVWFPNEQPLGLVLSCLDFWHPSGRQGVREQSAYAWGALGQLYKAIVSQDYSVANTESSLCFMVVAH